MTVTRKQAPASRLPLTVLFSLLVCSWSCVSCSRTIRCEGTDMNVTTSTGVKIEPYNSSRVELHLGPRYRFYKELMFAFEFRTDSANGTLFYGRSEAYPEEFVALVLRNGRPVHKIQCPSLHADITLPSTIFPPLNDNRWHRVIYSTRLGRFGYNGIIDVDGTNHTSVYEVNCEDFDTVIFGGHRPTHVGTLLPAEMTDHGSFEGCMKEAYFPYPFSSPGGYYDCGIAVRLRNPAFRQATERNSVTQRERDVSMFLCVIHVTVKLRNYYSRGTTH